MDGPDAVSLSQGTQEQVVLQEFWARKFQTRKSGLHMKIQLKRFITKAYAQVSSQLMVNTWVR